MIEFFFSADRLARHSHSAPFSTLSQSPPPQPLPPAFEAPQTYQVRRCSVLFALMRGGRRGELASAVGKRFASFARMPSDGPLPSRSRHTKRRRWKALLLSAPFFRTVAPSPRSDPFTEGSIRPCVEAPRGGAGKNDARPARCGGVHFALFGLFGIICH